jgi:hypothetical protein
MIFSLDVRRARKGDCLLLHFGTAENPHLIIIDGGPSNVYGPHLKPRIEKIRSERGLAASKALPVDVLMVSHVDDDHIRGILDLTREEMQAVGAKQPKMLKVLDFWHNSFDAVISHNTKPLTAAFTKHFGAAAVNGGPLSDDAVDKVVMASDEETDVLESGLQVLASIEQGFRLRDAANALDYPLNAAFDNELIVARKDAEPAPVAELEVTVVGPMLKELDALRKKHVEWLEALKAAGKEPPTALAEYVDKSVPNLSSLVFLVEAGKKRILLTGDARGDKIIEGLELVGLLETNGTIDVDILKVPHHGSSNNLDDDFFERIRAPHYVFSGNGEHGNPERESLAMLFKARGSAPLTVHLTYPVAKIDEERKKDWEKEQAKEKKRKAAGSAKPVRDDWSDEENSLAAFLDALELAPGQNVVIVDEKQPHVIDLFEPLGY